MTVSACVGVNGPRDSRAESGSPSGGMRKPAEPVTTSRSWLSSACPGSTIGPFLLPAAAILSPTFHGQTWLIFVLLLAGFQWMVTARIVRGMTLSLKEREFVQAARFMGVPGWRIILRHILPNMSSILIIDATVNLTDTYTLLGGLVGGAMLSAASHGTDQLIVQRLLAKRAEADGFASGWFTSTLMSA